MAAKNALQEIKASLLSDKIIFGTERTLQFLKQDKLANVFISLNAPDEVKTDIASYCETNDCGAEQLSISNQELGVICKKQFPVSVVGLLK